MTPEPAHVALLAPPGPLRDGLRALLAALPSVSRTTVVDSVVQAAAVFPTDPPDVVVLDSGSARLHLPADLASLRAAAPGCACLVLVEEVPAIPAASPAQRLLVKGAPATELVAALEALIAVRPSLPNANE